MRLIIPILLVIAIYCTGCQERLTKDEWNLRYPPDVNAVKARLMQEEGEQTIRDKAEMTKIERGCISVGIIAVISLGVLAWLKMTGLLFIPVSVIFGCGSGITLIEMNSHYPKIMPLLGAGFVLVFAGAAVYYLIAKMKAFGALKEVVGNVENIKKAEIIERQQQAVIKAELGIQSPATKSLVAGIRKKSNGDK